MILIGGGSRSGKTRFALNLARHHGPRLAYIATAQLYDDEMRARAERHRAERGSAFHTIEEPRHLAAAIRTHAPDYDAIVVDCLTLWASNLILQNQSLDTRELAATALASPSTVILVTNEVGCGIVPDNELARRFRDEAGWMNQTIAEHAREVYWLIFGQPIKLKPQPGVLP